jgi:hypothetical protein
MSTYPERERYEILAGNRVRAHGLRQWLEVPA